MQIKEIGKDTIIYDVKDFDLEQTLECGQCFRFYKQNTEDYVLVQRGKLLHIIQDKDKLIFKDISISDVKNIWIPYFDLERDYSQIKNFLLNKDKKLQPAIQEKWGVRILNQEFYEMVISFIISQNKQIPHIKKIVEDLSVKYGEYLGEVNGKAYYSFPSIETLGKITEEEYRQLKTGFRAPYLYDASRRLYKKEITDSQFASLSEQEALNKLTQIKGVGNKVASCVMLFSLGYRDAFPVDVWIKRIMETLYFEGKETSKETISEFAKKTYGAYGGYAQQYLFCFGRDNKMGK